MASEHDMMYLAARSPFGLVVRGNVKALREARSSMREDIALLDLVVLGPDGSGLVWLIRKDKIRGEVTAGARDVAR